MSILTATNLSQSYGFVDVFTGLSASVPHGAKIGLVGPNGVGKTTLLKLLCGIEEPSWGEVRVAKGVRLGYLRQEAMEAFEDDANTVHEEMLTAFARVHEIERRMREIEDVMAGGDHAAMDEYGELQEQFAHLGGYDIETSIAQTLDGLGFNRGNWDTQVKHLSGGQKTRALLARLLLEQPDLLILDEPTNHLDIEAIEWLEKTLREWKGALIVSSHDRFFLDRVVTTIWEMGRARIEVFRGNYTAYTQQRDERFQRSLFVFSQEKARLEKEMAYIKANAPGEPSVQSRGKLKRLTRDVVTIERLGAEVLVNENWSDIATKVGYVPFPFGVEEAEKRVANLRPPSKPPKVELELTVEKRSGEMVLRTTGLEVGYRNDRVPRGQGDKESGANAVTLSPGHLVTHTLFKADDLYLTWKDRAALIGPNGAGKTTFIRTALGQYPPPLKGSAELGSSLKIAYFAQAHEELNAERTVLEELKENSPKRMSDGEARYYLAQFLFRNDDVFKPVGGLSGGEKARLALAILQLKGANFLVLDEPTNHLDILSQEVLQAALAQFGGTILLVSHDRYLIDKLATQIWWIHDGRLQAYRGTYAEWSKWRAAQPPSSGGGVGGGGMRTTRRTIAQTPFSPTPSSSGRGAKNADKKRQQQIAEAEARVAALEAKLKELAEAMQKRKGTADVSSLGIEYALAQRELDEAMKQWELASTDGRG